MNLAEFAKIQDLRNKRRAPYVSRGGEHLYKPVVSTERLFELEGGWCLACGQHVDNIEPDARKATCECCGKPKVYGYEELAVKNLIKFV